MFEKIKKVLVKLMVPFVGTKVYQEPKEKIRFDNSDYQNIEAQRLKVRYASQEVKRKLTTKYIQGAIRELLTPEFLKAAKNIEKMTAGTEQAFHYAVMKFFKERGINTIPLSASILTKTEPDEKEFGQEALVLFELQASLLNLPRRYKEKKEFDKELELLKFFGHIPPYVMKYVEEEVDAVYTSRGKKTFKPISLEKTPSIFKESMLYKVVQTMNDFGARHLKEKKKGKPMAAKLMRFALDDFNNLWGEVSVVFPGADKSLNIHIPMEDSNRVTKIGRLSLMRNRDTNKNSHLSDAIRPGLAGLVNITTHFRIRSERMLEVFAEKLQNDILALYFGNKIIRPWLSDDEYRQATRGYGPYDRIPKKEELEERLEFKFVNYTLLDYQGNEEPYKFFMNNISLDIVEFTHPSRYIDPLKIDFKQMKDGALNLPFFPNNIRTYDRFLYNYIGSVGTRVNENIDKIRATKGNRFPSALAGYDNPTRVIVGSNLTIDAIPKGKATRRKPLFLDPANKPLQKFHPPFGLYFTWLTNEKFGDEGFLLREDLHIGTPSGEFHHGDKFGVDSGGKGKVYVTKKQPYFYHNGERVNIDLLMNGESYASRKNPSSYIESVLNMKRWLEDPVKAEETILRDFDVNPVTEEELNLDFIEIFVEEDGKEVSLGFDAVVRMKGYISESQENSFSSRTEEELKTAHIPLMVTGMEELVAIAYSLGLEKFYKYMTDHNLPYKNFYKEIINGERDLAEGEKVGGKEGRAFKRMYSASMNGFYAQVGGSYKVKKDEAWGVLKAYEFEYWIRKVPHLAPKVDELMEQFNNLKEGEYITLPGTMMRQPIMDARKSFMPITYRFYNGKHDPFLIHGYFLVNTATWSVMGGDFDGDAGIFTILPTVIWLEVKTYFGFVSKDVEDHYEEAAEKFHPDKWKKDYTTHQGLIEHWFKMKNKEYDPTFLTNNKRTTNLTLFPMLLTTFLGKSGIGFAKDATMKMVAMISNISALDRNKEINKPRYEKLLERAYELNDIIVQPTIDIQKWSESLGKVKKLYGNIAHVRRKADTLLLAALPRRKTLVVWLHAANKLIKKYKLKETTISEIFEYASPLNAAFFEFVEAVLGENLNKIFLHNGKQLYLNEDFPYDEINKNLYFDVEPTLKLLEEHL